MRARIIILASIIIMCLLLLALVPKVRSHDEGDAGGRNLLHLVSICDGKWRVSNHDESRYEGEGGWYGEATWQIWSNQNYDSGGFEGDMGEILFEGHVNVPAFSNGEMGTATFTTPAGYYILLFVGPEVIDAIGIPSDTACSNDPPPYRMGNVFKITVEGSYVGQSVYVYHVGDVFLDNYSGDDLGFDIPVAPVSDDRIISLLMRDVDWPASMNFVMMLQIEDGSLTPIVEFTLGKEWPDIFVRWTAEGVSNAR